MLKLHSFIRLHTHFFFWWGGGPGGGGGNFKTNSFIEMLVFYINLKT